ncbi:MAG TPA: ABC transporter substrate-binding protein [Chloroflexota bacterium]|nr:ABC transporter substrate-binding protein [Chloroflexota bacterium]
MTVKAADGQSLTQTGLYVAVDKNYFREEGLNVELVPLSSFEAVIPSLTTGEIDVGLGGVSPLLFNAFARGINVRIVATAALHAPGRSQLIVARKDLVESGQLKSYTDLKGKKIARAAALSIDTIAFEKGLGLGGLTLNDVEFITLAFPEIVAALSNKAVDVAYLSEPFATSAIDKGIAVKWHEMADLVPNHAGSLWLYSQQLVEKQPEAGRRFMAAMLRGVRDYEDGFAKNKGRPEVVASLIKHTPIKDASVYDRMIAIKYPTSGELPLDTLQQDLDWLRDHGAVPQAPDLAKVVDSQFITYAAQRLGPYA